MKKLDSLEKYVRVPDTQFFGTYFYDGEDIILHDEVEEFKEEKTRLTIKDEIKDGVFHKYKLLEDLKNKIKEETNVEYPVKEKDMFIFVQYEGFVKTKTKLVPIEEAIKQLKMLDSSYYDENGNLKEE